jgi:pimeloyl-ACP methyl ester carboxylesterase
VSVRSLGQKIAEAGYRVVVYDRRNTGASTVAIEGDSENEVWAEDLYELLKSIDALPAYIGGSSSGCRLAMVLALRRPEAVRGLLLWRVTGGAYAAERLCNQYYTAHIEAAKKGGMAEVCAMEHWTEVIAANPRSRERLMAMDPQDFIGRMTRWRDAFNAGTDHAVIGLSPADLRSMTMPACVIPGNDRVHPPQPRPGGPPLHAEQRIPRGHGRRPHGRRRRLRGLGRERGIARRDLHRLPAAAGAAIAAPALGRHPGAGRDPLMKRSCVCTVGPGLRRDDDLARARSSMRQSSSVNPTFSVTW